MQCETQDEKDSLETQKRVWDKRLSAVIAALLERMPEEQREQYIQKLRTMWQAYEDSELEQAYEDSELAQSYEGSELEQSYEDSELAQSYEDSELEQSYEDSELDYEKRKKEAQSRKKPEQTVEKYFAKMKKQLEEHIQRHCPPIPDVNVDSSTSSWSNINPWKYLHKKPGNFKSFILGDSPQAKMTEGLGSKKLNDIQSQNEERMNPIMSMAASDNNGQPNIPGIRQPDVWHESNPSSINEHAPTVTSKRSACSDLANSEVCQYN